jgi:hypothetical protein
MASDGSVVIDTKIDTKGFSKGMDDLREKARMAFNSVLLTTFQKIEGIKSEFKKLGAAGADIFKKLLLGAMVIFALSARKIFSDLRESIGEVLNLKGNEGIKAQVEGIQNQFVELRSAVALAFLPLIEAAIPYIKMALSWLIELFNKAAMITAAFTGQKQALQVIQGSAQKIADANKKTEKATRGQLAAFDQINVLQKEQADKAEADAPKVAAQMLPITNDILGKVQEIKNTLTEWWNDPIGKAKELGNTLKEKFLDFVFWDNWKRFFAGLVDSMKQKWQEFKEFIFLDNWIAFFGQMWEAIKSGAIITWEIIKGIWGAIAPFFQIVFETVIQIIKDRFDAMHEIIAAAKLWFSGLIDFITGVFTGNWQKAWAGIASMVEGVFNGIKAFIKLTANTIIDVINGLLRAVTIGVNAISNALNSISFTIPDWVPGLGGGQFSLNIPTVTAPQIPHLATGGVIPGGASFLAVLGDQRAGQTNIEAPADLIRSIVREELGNAGTQEATVPIVLTLDGEQIWKNQQRVSFRRGKSLLAGGNV